MTHSMLNTLSRILSEEPLLRPALFSTIPATKSSNPIRYNVSIDEADNSAVYEIALPGYSKSEVEVRYSENRLTISSSKSDPNSDKTESGGYVVWMFGKRPFSLSWSVSDAKVSSATMVDGVLRVVMSRDVNRTSQLIPIT